MGKHGPPKGRPTTTTKPFKAKHVVTPEHLEMIAEMHLEGQTLSQMAAATGLPKYVVRYQLETFIRPAWKVCLNRNPGEEIAKLDAVERWAWRLLREAVAVQGTPRTDGAPIQPVVSVASCFATIKDAIAERCKILGHYAKPDKFEGSLELRFVGKSPDELNREMLERLKTKVSEHRAYALALATTGSEN